MYITCFYRVGDTHAVKMGHDGSRWVESIRICASGTSKLARITSAHRSSECRHCTYPPSLLLPGMSGAMRQWVHALLSTTAMLWVQTTLCIAWMESYSFHLNVVNVLYTSGSSPSNCFGLVHSVSGYHSAKGDTQFLTNTWVFHQSVLVYSERKYSSLQLCTTLPKAASKGPPRRRLPAAWRGFPGRPSGVTRRDTSWHVTWHVVTVCDWHFNAGTGKSWKIHGCFTSFHYVWASEVQRIKCQNTNKQYEDNAK